MKTKNQPMSDLERINRSYVTGGQAYTPYRIDDGSVVRTEDQQDAKDGLQSRPPAQESNED